MNPKTLTLGLAALTFAATAHATPTFPAVLQDELKLASTPDCTVCHVGAFARSTVTTALGKALMNRGLKAGDEASLRTAIRALVAENNPEIGKLKGGAITPAGAEYGCAFAAAPPGEGLAWATALAASAALVASRRRRR